MSDRPRRGAGGETGRLSPPARRTPVGAATEIPPAATRVPGMAARPRVLRAASTGAGASGAASAGRTGARWPRRAGVGRAAARGSAAAATSGRARASVRAGAAPARQPVAGLQVDGAAWAAPQRAVRVEPRAVRVALLGLGTVGAGLLRVLEANRAAIERKVGRGIEVCHVLVRDAGKPRAVCLADGVLTTDPERVLGDPGVHVVVEAMGGIHPALDYMLRALRAGRSVVTANKDVMAEHGQEVWAAAEAGGADVMFEASVGGGIPIVRALKQSLAGNAIRRVAGVLNGTTNYILTRMTQDGLSLERALQQAQALGYAEADPSADLDGMDAARKLAILSSIAYSSRCRPDQVYRQGIRDVTAADIAHAARLGWVIKLLAISELRDGRVSMRVHPTFIPQAHPLAAVHDAFNAIYVQGDAVGDAMFYGRGAGALPTASAVLGDLMEVARFVGRGGAGTACTCFYRRPPLPMGRLSSRFYVRLLVPDRVGVLAKIAGVFGRCGVSILSVLQVPRGEAPEVAAGGGGPEGDYAELILVTHGVREDRMEAAVAGLGRLDVVAGVGAVIRLAPEDL